MSDSVKEAMVIVLGFGIGLFLSIPLALSLMKPIEKFMDWLDKRRGP